MTRVTKCILSWITALVVLLLFGLCSPLSLHAQVAPVDSGVHLTPFNYGYVEDSARVMLEQAWSEWDESQPERAYCVLAGDVKAQEDTVNFVMDWKVRRIVPAAISHATPYAISFSCPDSTIGTIHTHTPTTCKNTGTSAMTPVWACELGGHDAYLCSVDQWDQKEARKEGLMFSIVQCSKHSFVWYFPNKRS